MNDEIFQMFVKIAQYAPYFLIVNGFWMIGNTQIFVNEWTPVIEMKQYNGHVLLKLISDRAFLPENVYAIPLLFLILFCCIKFLLEHLFPK